MKRVFLLTVACCVAHGAAARQTQEAQPPVESVTNHVVDTNLISQVPQPPARKTRVLSLEDCIALALQHNFDIQIQKYNPVISQYKVGVDIGAYEPTFSFSASKNYNDRPGGINPQTGLPFLPNLSESDTFTPQIQGVLPTGTKYDLVGSWQRQSIRDIANTYWLAPDWQANPGINLTQPLLKNFWIDSTRLQIKLDKDALKISEQAIRLQVMTSVTAVKEAYFNLLYARGNVDANTTALKLAQQLVSENLKKVEVGALAPLDEKQSESQAAASLAALQSAIAALATQENTLKNLLTDNYSEWADLSPVPSEELSVAPRILDRQESWRRAITQRPELIEAKLKVEQQNIQLKYDQNQIFPELDLTGSYGRNSFNSTFNGGLDDIKNGSSSFYSYGAALTLPLGGNVSARNTSKSDKVLLKQVLLQLKQQEQTILVAVDNDVSNVRSSLLQVDSTRAARLYAEDALAAERKKLENGKSTSFNVLQLISNLTTARVNEIQALANYNNALAQLSLDEGNTLEDNRIDMKLK